MRQHKDSQVEEQSSSSAKSRQNRKPELVNYTFDDTADWDSRFTRLGLYLWGILTTALITLFVLFWEELLVVWGIHEQAIPAQIVGLILGCILFACVFGWVSAFSIVGLYVTFRKFWTMKEHENELEKVQAATPQKTSEEQKLTPMSNQTTAERERLSRGPTEVILAKTSSQLMEKAFENQITAPQGNTLQELYERGIAELDRWIAEQGESTPEQRAEWAAWIAVRQLQRREREEKQRAEEAERRKLADYWLALGGRAFEEKMKELYLDLGYEEVELTPQSGDDGVDLILRAGTSMTVVQCKRQRQSVGPAAARELYGAMMHLRADDAILVSTSGFTSGVRDFVSGKAIQLLDIDNLVRMSQTAAWNLVMDGETDTLTKD